MAALVCGTLSPMRWLRPKLTRIAGGWLVLHVCLLVSIPTELCWLTSSDTSGAACACDHGDGQTCPMHRSQSSYDGAAPDSWSCTCRSASDPLAIATSLLSPAAVLATAVTGIAPMTSVGWRPASRAETAEPSSFPDSPPPRD